MSKQLLPRPTVQAKATTTGRSSRRSRVPFVAFLLHNAPQQVPDKATAMAQSRLLIMGIQGCRLPSLKLPKASNV